MIGQVFLAFNPSNFEIFQLDLISFILTRLNIRGNMSLDLQIAIMLMLKVVIMDIMRGLYNIKLQNYEFITNMFFLILNIKQTITPIDGE